MLKLAASPFLALEVQASSPRDGFSMSFAVNHDDLDIREQVLSKTYMYLYVCVFVWKRYGRFDLGLALDKLLQNSPAQVLT